MDLDRDCEDGPSLGTDIHSFRCPDECPDFFARLRNMRKSETLCDVTISTRGQSFKAHKVILLASCPSLEEKIQFLSEHPSLPLELDLDGEAVGTVLGYVYREEVRVPQERLGTVAAAALQLGVTRLRTSCIIAQLAATTLSSDTCLHVWMEAEDIGHEEFKKSALKYALSNFALIRKTKAFKDLPQHILRTYIGHDDLVVKNHEQRLSSALTWVRSDAARHDALGHLVEVLPIHKMAHWYLDQVLDDPLMQKAHPAVSIRIRAALEDITDQDRQKADLDRDISIDFTTKTEPCLVFTGAGVEGKRSDAVTVMRLDHEHRVVTLGRLKASFPDGLLRYGITNCCVHGEHLYVGGIGSRGGDLWRFNLTTADAVHYSRMSVRRQCHAIWADQAGHIYLFGGKTLGLIHSDPVTTVEKLDISGCALTELGPLKYGSPWRQYCLDLKTASSVLICGGEMETGNTIVQVYHLERGEVTHTLELPFTGAGNTCGGVVTPDHIIVVMKFKTFVMRLEDALSGNTDSVKVCENYLTPNKSCAIVQDASGLNILLLGGRPKAGKAKCYAYQASIQDVLIDADSGWQPASIPWSLGECLFVGGYCRADNYIL